jgi:hypothetical protein
MIVWISLTLAFATVALWVRSYHTADTWRWSGSKGQLREVALAPGQIRFATAPWCGTDFEHLTTYDHNRDVIFSRRWSSSGDTVLGIGFDQYTESILLGGFQGARPTGSEAERSRDLTVRVLTIRCPTLLLVFSVAPLYLVGARLLARRVRMGFCLGCGYDMRATPARCPECGLVPARPVIGPTLSP